MLPPPYPRRPDAHRSLSQAASKEISRRLELHCWFPAWEGYRIAAVITEGQMTFSEATAYLGTVTDVRGLYATCACCLSVVRVFSCTG